MKTLLLLHPFPFDSELFQFQLEPLKSVCNVVAIDLPGFGNAEVVPGISCDEIAARVVEECKAKGITSAIVGGVSMGGYIALAVARKHPEFVSGLILADTRAEPDDDAARENREKAIETVRTEGVAAFVDAQIPKAVGLTTRKDNAERAEWIRGIGARQSAEGIVAGIEMLRDRPDARPGLKSLTVPVLILVGEEDIVTPLSAAQAMKKMIPDAILYEIPQAGHLAHCEQPDAFNSMVTSFLKSI